MNIFRGKLFLVILCFLAILLLAFIWFWTTKSDQPTEVVENKMSLVSDTDLIKIQSGGKSIKLLFVGDIMLDRHIRQAALRQKSPCNSFEKVTSFLNSFDAVVGNNEGSVTNNISLSVNTTPENRNNYMFTFDPQVLECYKNNNIQVVSLGNNHSMNFGEDGIVQTTQNLRNSGIAYFGNPIAINENAVIKSIKEKKIAFVSFNYAYGPEYQIVNSQIKALKNSADFIVVYAHWGSEYSAVSNAQQRFLGRGFVDSGADIVVGMHPHVIQDDELYNGKRIFYSLGNFIFDQYFSDETRKGMGIGMILNPDKTITFTKYFFQNSTNGQVSLLESETSVEN